jgi:hypothetical protein
MSHRQILRRLNQWFLGPGDGLGPRAFFAGTREDKMRRREKLIAAGEHEESCSALAQKRRRHAARPDGRGRGR